MNEPLEIISNADSSTSVLLANILKLEAGEGAEFWTDIANNPVYNNTHRRLAVWALFNRHIHAPLSLYKFNNYLNNPTWVTDEIVQVTELGGNIPVSFNGIDSTFMIPVLKTADQPGAAIYIRFKGDVSLKTLQEGLFSATPAESLNETTIAELAFEPTQITDEIST